MERPQHIAIVGGGITGLAAAHAIVQANRQLGLGVACTLLEATERFGGKVQTERVHGFLLEQGPDSLLARKVEARRFCEELGLAHEIVGSCHHHGGTYVVQRGRLEPLPESMVLVAPTRLAPWLKTRLLSPAGKLRAALDLLLPARQDDSDESLAAFVCRRLGSEVAERLAVPLLASVYGGGGDELSLLATFPELRKLERRHRSLLLGLRATARQRRGAGGASPFISLRSGLGTMVSTAVAALDGVRLRSSAPVTGLTVEGPRNGRWHYRLTIAGGGAIEADAVILATPAFVTQRVLERLAPAAAEALSAIDYGPAVVVTIAFPRARIAHPRVGTGFLVPASAQRRIIACTCVTNKWPHASDPDKMLFRCYVGGPDAAALLALPDQELVWLVCEELRDLLGVEGPPLLSRVCRWPNAIPRYRVGHLERVHQAEAAVREAPGLALAGAAYRGIGVPDCIRQGRVAAAALLGLGEGEADG